MKTATIDIETNLAHDTIWCCGVHYHGGEALVVTSPEALREALQGVGTIVTHNGIAFDIPLLRSLWGVDLSEYKSVDTIVLSRLYNPSLIGGHSLKAWGDRFKYPKGDFTDYDGGYCEEMAEYCVRDVELTTRLHDELLVMLDKEGFGGECIQLEHEVAEELVIQVSNGFKLDLAHANQLYSTLTHRMRVIEEELQEKFPPIITPRVSEKTGKALKDGVEVFNVGSRLQIVKRLTSVGVKFSERTDAGGYKVDETVLGAIDHPDAQLVGEFLIVQKRAGLVSSWLTLVTDEGRVHGKVIGSGAATGRMSHTAPNMAQIPAVRHLHDGMSPIDVVKSTYGAACRECWIVEEGNKLVGIDASGLELRILAHYMKDEEYINTILEGDIHSANQAAAGLDTRDQAKTFIYAFLYGAGDAKIGSIANKGAAHGKKLKKAFLDNVPALKRLKDVVEGIAEKSGSVPSLDGRRIRIRKSYSALNFLLQGGGAVLMKKALILGTRSLREANIPFKIVANVHDELQVEVQEHLAKAVGIHFKRAIRDAGEVLELRCPMDGEYKVGDNWSCTH
jgi:DNA polymerase I